MGSKPFKLNFLDKRYSANPFEAFAELRQQGEVFRGRIPILGKTWLATSYSAAREVFRDQSSFARDPKNAGKPSQLPIQWLMPSLFRRMTSNMLGVDGEDHRRLRSLADQAFRRRNVEAIQDRLKVIAVERLRLAEKSSDANGVVDLVRNFTRSFPLAVISELLGLPAEDHERFTRWFAPLSNVSGPIGFVKAMLAVRKGYKYIQRQIETQRNSPRDGLIAELIRAEEDGHQLTTEELESTIIILLLAGHETTVHLIGVSILMLLRMPEIREKFLDNDEFAGKTIQEILRYGSVAHYGKPRWVTRDMTFYGVDLKRGEAMMPVIATANYDPTVFAEPNVFNIERENNSRHLTFGSGPHVCIGLKLAEAETLIALRALWTRYSNLQPMFDIHHPPWGNRMGMRALRELPVKLVD